LQKPESSEVWIVDASPIIALAKVGYLQLLDQPSETWIPETVASEVLAGSANDPGRKVLESGWGRRAAPNLLPDAVLEWGLGMGETAVLALALEQRGRTAVLDDAAARSCARAFGVPVLGTLGLVLRAKRTGLIPSAVQVLEALLAVGLRLDHQTVRTALYHSTGERWPHGG
jgi:predicted nucleic acid-binding protein